MGLDDLNHEFNQKVVLDLALGREPAMPHRKGEHELSGKFMMRLFKDEISDGTVRKVPSKEDIERVRTAYPHALVQALVEEAMRLSDLKFQDSDSYEIAVVFLGADRHRVCGCNVTESQNHEQADSGEKPVHQPDTTD